MFVTAEYSGPATLKWLSGGRLSGGVGMHAKPHWFNGTCFAGAMDCMPDVEAGCPRRRSRNALPGGPVRSPPRARLGDANATRSDSKGTPARRIDPMV